LPRGIMALFRRAAPRYIFGMKLVSHQSAPTVAIIATVAAIGIAIGLAFASWIDNGAAIFLAMVESGLAWCF
jgi:hypothetical protein